MIRKLALCNQKGGVGKTATTLGLASALSAQGRNVLIVDVDPQGNSTTGLGVEITDGMMTTFDLMNRTASGSAADAVIATPWDRVDLIPSNEALANIESDGANDLIFRLDIAFEGLDLSPYDAVLFDCPPSLGKLLFAVLCAVDGVIAVTEPTIDSVRGIENLQETIRNVQRRPNPRLVMEKSSLAVNGPPGSTNSANASCVALTENWSRRPPFRNLPPDRTHIALTRRSTSLLAARHWLSRWLTQIYFPSWRSNSKETQHERPA